MLRSILVTAFRNMVRNRTFTIINLFGLAVSMSLSLFIIIMMKEQYSYDNFHIDADQIFRVNTEAQRKSGDTESYATSPVPLEEALKSQFPAIEETVSLNRRLRTEVIEGNSNLSLKGLFTEPSFFKVFNFDLVKGNKATALVKPNSLILTEQTAKRLFGEEDPLNKVITLDQFGDYTITGIIHKPANTHIDFEALGSLSSLAVLDKSKDQIASDEDWLNYYVNYLYVKTKEGADTSNFDAIAENISKSSYAGLALESRDRGYRFYLQPLGKITPGPILSNQLGNGMPFLLLLILGVLAAIVMIMACLNYTQLTIAKSISRAREIGVRKVNGAKRWQVFVQFIGEAVIFSIVALIISYLFFQLLKPAFLRLHIPDEFAITLSEDFFIYGLFLAFAIVVGIVAGLFPALFLSRFNPANVLKGGQTTSLNSKVMLRKILMVIQLTISITFVIIILMMNKQTVYMNTADYGLVTKGVVNIPLGSAKFDQFANEVKTLSPVVNVSGISHNLGTWEDRSSDYKTRPDAEAFGVRDFLVDENYLGNVGIKLKGGRFFNVSDRSNTEHVIIINEKALETFELGDTNSALGKFIYVNDSVPVQIIGVTENFNFRPLNYSIGPLVFRLRPDDLSIANVKMIGNDKAIANMMLDVEAIWKKYDPNHPFEWNMMDADIKNAYEDSGSNDIVKIVGYISFLAVTIAFMGLLGMVMFSVQKRLKEIGIRKVMGASQVQIVGLLNKSFAILFVIAIAVGAPLGYQIGSLFLNNFAFKAETGWPILVMALSMILSVGVLTISIQTIKAAMTNPVRWLRYE